MPSWMGKASYGRLRLTNHQWIVRTFWEAKYPSSPYPAEKVQGRKGGENTGPTVANLVANVESETASIGRVLHTYYSRFKVREVATRTSRYTEFSKKTERQRHKNAEEWSNVKLWNLKQARTYVLEVTVHLESLSPEKGQAGEHPAPNTAHETSMPKEKLGAEHHVTTFRVEAPVPQAIGWPN